jgi:hypothetical protein
VVPGTTPSDRLEEKIMTAPTATAARDLHTPRAPHRSNGRAAVVAVLVVAVLVVAVLALAAVFGLRAEPAAFALLGSWAGIGLIVAMAGLPLLLEMEDHWAQGEPSSDHRGEHPRREHT